MYTRKLFVEVAVIMYDAKALNYNRQQITARFVHLFEGDNPNFDSARFMKACGYDAGELDLYL